VHIRIPEGVLPAGSGWVTLDELVPEVYAHGEGHGATLGIAFVVVPALVLMGLILGVKRGPELPACMRFHTRGGSSSYPRRGTRRLGDSNATRPRR